MSLKRALEQVRENIYESQKRGGFNHPVSIVAVTKTHPSSTIEKVYDCGIRKIGENRVQEFERKNKELPQLEGIKKHMIGHLQKNKIKKALELFDTIDSIDSVSLAKKIDKNVKTKAPPVSVLLEVNTSNEKTKFGFSPNEIEEMVFCCLLENISVGGLLTIGPRTKEIKETRKSFALLRVVLERINKQLPPGAAPCTELSMGMSGDYRVAVEEGSTTVRLGTALFGARRTIIK